MQFLPLISTDAVVLQGPRSYFESGGWLVTQSGGDENTFFFCFVLLLNNTDKIISKAHLTILIET